MPVCVGIRLAIPQCVKSLTVATQRGELPRILFVQIRYRIPSSLLPWMASVWTAAVRRRFCSMIFKNLIEDFPLSCWMRGTGNALAFAVQEGVKNKAGRFAPLYSFVKSYLDCLTSSEQFALVHFQFGTLRTIAD